MVLEDDRNVLILHSSGTTGLPKPIYLAHRYMLGYATCHEFPETDDQTLRGVTLSTLPLFHGFGFLAPSLSLSVGRSFCLPPSSTISNASLVISLLRQIDIRSMMSVPSIMEDFTLLHDFETAAQTLAKLDFIAIGGGGLKHSVGKRLHSQGVTLLNHFGATELGPLAPIFYPKEDYDYNFLRLRKDMRLELVFTDPDLGSGKTKHPRPCKLIGYPFAWGAKFELQDELECNPLHPTSEVRILGRMDDLIVLATGEKVMPQLLELALEEHPSVRRAIAFGDGQDELGILVEPDGAASVNEMELIEALWQIILKVNMKLDGHARLSSKASILIKPIGKEIPISDKGSVQRKEVYRRFDSEIKAVYKQLQESFSSGLAMPFDDTAPQKCIRDMIQSCLPDYVSSHSWPDDIDIIQLGMDSLQITRLYRILCASLDHSGRSRYRSSDIGKDFIYLHPSVSQLTSALTSDSPSVEADVAYTMEQLTLRYATEDAECIPSNQGSVVLLTGATGSLGAHVVKVLCETRTVKGIIALVRTNANGNEPNARERLQGSLEERGIVLSDAAWSKINLLTWTPGSDLLGLSRAEYDSLASRVTHILHGAWPMDFERGLASFEPHIKTVKDLIELGRSIHRSQPAGKSRIFLLSSIAVLGWHPLANSSQPIPETLIKDAFIPLPMGYAQAKLVCENIIESAQRNLQDEIDCRICRIGQLSGATSTGFWSSNEHIPALVKASQAIGVLPDLRGVS